MNGPVQGVATKAASAPVPKPPAGCAAPAEHRKLEQAEQVGGDGGRQQQQQQDRARILQLERPAGRGAAGADQQQDRAKRAGAAIAPAA